MPRRRSAAVAASSSSSSSITNSSNTGASAEPRSFLTVAPALPHQQRAKPLKAARTRTAAASTSLTTSLRLKRPQSNATDQIQLKRSTTTTACESAEEDAGDILHVHRSDREKAQNPDRVSLDGRGLTRVPRFDDDDARRLRLISLQRNLLTALDGFRSQSFRSLVFLDVYDNQLERIDDEALRDLETVRVLLLGKNRIRKIEGLSALRRLEVLDLHGNRIDAIGDGLAGLVALKVLNLAGNRLRAVAAEELRGLDRLEEFNLRRNQLQRVTCFAETPNLIKIYLGHNEIASVEAMSGIARASTVREITIDNNPVAIGCGDCASFLASYLPNLRSINGLQVTERVRRAATAWRRNKERTSSSPSPYARLANDLESTARRDIAVSNARTNWELLRQRATTASATAPPPPPLNVAAASASLSSSSAIGRTQKPLKPGADMFTTSLNVAQETDAGAAIVTTHRRATRSSSSSNVATSSSSQPSIARCRAGRVPILPEKTAPSNLCRTQSLESETVASSSSISCDHRSVRLPPIVAHQPIRTSASSSSLGPNVDSSSIGSSPSSRSDTEDEEASRADSCDKKPIERVEKAVIIPASDAPKCEATIDDRRHDAETTDASSNLSSSDCTASLSTSADDRRRGRAAKSAQLASKRSLNATPAAPNTKQRPVTAKTRAKSTAAASPTTTDQPPVADADREHGGDYLIEIRGRHLNVYGQGALRFVDRAASTWSTAARANDVRTANFNYVNFNHVAPLLPRLKQRFPHVEHFAFKETNIVAIAQLNAFAELKGITSLTIDADGNAVTERDDWRTYAIYRLNHWGLKFINGRAISAEDVATADARYEGLSALVVRALPDALLRPLIARLHLDAYARGVVRSQDKADAATTNDRFTAKRWLSSADPALRNVVSKEALQWKAKQDDGGTTMRQKRATAFVHLAALLDDLSETVDKLRLLDDRWPTILNEIVRNCLMDYAHLNLYMKRRMQELIK